VIARGRRPTALNVGAPVTALQRFRAGPRMRPIASPARCAVLLIHLMICFSFSAFWPGTTCGCGGLLPRRPGSALKA